MFFLSAFVLQIWWMESKDVEDRILEIWKNITKIINFGLWLSKLNQPSCFFFFFACPLERFKKKKNQSDIPMTAYLYQDLIALFFFTLLELVVKPRVLEAAKLAYANWTKEKIQSLPRNLALRTSGESLIVFSIKVNLLYLVTCFPF